MTLIADIETAHDDLTALRRDIHAHPELAFQETRTSDLVAERLGRLGLEVHRGLGKTGVVGVLRGARGGQGRAIGLRADMDALPMPEHNRFAHASRHPGRMHGCGHDGHTTMLLGAAQYLAQHRDFEGVVNFIFQPAEEGGNAGARAMIEDGLLERFPCDEIHGLHNMPGTPMGTFAFRKGAMMASSNRFDIVIRGTGGHAAMPEKAVDPIIIAAEMVGALQTIISRSKSPIDTAVLSVTQIHAGDAYNVIPDEAVLRGTVRTFSTEVLDRIESRMRHVAQTLPQVYGASGELQFVRAYPPLVNWDAQTDFAAQVAQDVFGAAKVVRDAAPVGGAEDFSFYLEKVPGTYLFLGNGDGAHRERPITAWGHANCTTPTTTSTTRYCRSARPTGSGWWRLSSPGPEGIGTRVLRGSASRELEVGDLRRRHRSHELKSVQAFADTVEQPLALPEQDRHEVDVHLVHETGREILLGGFRSAGKRHILAAGGLPRRLERRTDAVGDEGEGRPTLEHEWLARVVREHEYRVVERRISAPPAGPRLLRIPGTGVAAEHVAPHDGGTDVGERFLDDRGAFVGLSAVHADHRAKRSELEGPLVETPAADSERVAHALAGTGDEAVERHRDLEAQPGHACLTPTR